MEEFRDVLRWIFQMPSLAYSFVSTSGTDFQLLQIQIYLLFTQPNNTKGNTALLHSGIHTSITATKLINNKRAILHKNVMLFYAFR
jgi:hypothetical protein